MTEAQVRNLLIQKIRQFGGDKAFAQRIGLSRWHVSNVRAGRKALSRRILADIGIEAVAVTTYRRKRDAKLKPQAERQRMWQLGDWPTGGRA